MMVVSDLINKSGVEVKSLVIERDKLKSNIEIIKGMTSSRIIAVLKGNGYGLDIVSYGRLLLENSVDYFAVSELQEALTLRENGFENDIMLLTSTSNEEEVEVIVRNNIMPTVGSLNSAVAVNEAGKKLGVMVNVHLKIDTGFGRFGFLYNQMDTLCDILKLLTNVNVVGTYSHFSSSFIKKPKVMESQLERFLSCIKELKQKGFETGMLHIAASCAFLRYQNTHLDAVRIGSAFLGRVPVKNKYNLRRVGYMKSRVIELKDLPKDYYIGYANTFKTKGPTKIAIVPVGYKDGFGVEKSKDTFRFRDILRYMLSDFRSFKKCIYVTVNGKKARVLGRISMYNIIVDVTNIDIQLGDEVILDINPILVDSSINREFI